MDPLKQNPNHYMDLAAMDDLRQKAQSDPNASLKEVALQFEGIFLGMMLKEMRSASAVLESDSPFNSQTSKFYQDMQDQQLVSELSSQGALGLADLIVAQLGGDDALTPASALRGQAGMAMAAAPVTSSVSAVAESAPKVEPALPRPPLAAAANPEPDFSQPRSFVDSLMPHAQVAADKLGVSPELLVAQSALETGWGRKVLPAAQGSSNNLFNIKAGSSWQGDKVAINALEVEQGMPVKRRSEFRVYGDIADSFSDFVEFVNKPRYRDALDAGNDEGFIRGLQQAGYATDPAYADKVLQVMKRLMTDTSLVPKGSN
ncbi:flagellar assembly peptidoglycan hydrolase FlgJ [Ferrimonas sp. SCSIO 43195]|uniref:flagellar assembly peptidoglycan hydrolase FlgJ n=1 Tax=Ferrimonas sp. SCSIO 43195 TaxID=2822844 RepID=UPI0020765105|nr:flagellar assembly peptidoglycan hydrolase FlgJ [Ferrimonas sp. SCSIO 43195]USD38614.1 flagellar assembly peptidoglycan hydrolase FlgJ [Ferrimonas sp. SCSIO 43195]